VKLLNNSYSLRFRKGHFDPSLITLVLGIKPDHQWSSGSPRISSDGRELGVHPTSYWSSRLSDFQGLALAEAISRTITVLQPHADYLSELSRSGCWIELFVGIFLEESNGEEVEANSLKELGSLGINLSLDMYS